MNLDYVKFVKIMEVNMISILNEIVFIIFFIIIAIKDLKKKYISQKLLIIYFISGIFINILKIYINSFNYIELIKSLIFGLFIYILSKITKECIGTGDAIYFMINSLYINFYDNLMLFMIGIFTAGGIGFILYILNKGKIKNKTIAFIPCITLGIIWRIICL